MSRLIHNQVVLSGIRSDDLPAVDQLESKDSAVSEKERSDKTVMCLQREKSPNKLRHESTKVVEERKIIDVLKIGRA